ncbi:MAG: GatB/YqeY domain-containing protein [Firmicutes bacterium]|nr:GatB/YqeY domain-containing protein [Bacillota bacterium]
MSLLKRLDDDLKTAMKQREAGRVRLSVIRMAKAAIKNLQIDKGRELTEEEVLEVIAREMKLRRDTLPEFERANRPDKVEELKAEMAILEEYLPAQLDEAELKALVQAAVVKSGAQGPKEIGKVMALVMPQVKGRADGKLVNRIVNQTLAEKQ